jgi:alkyl hydroperoxide reductase subunit AhpF
LVVALYVLTEVWPAKIWPQTVDSRSLTKAVAGGAKSGASKIAAIIACRPRRFTHETYQKLTNRISTMKQAVVTIYSRTGCHLCENVVNQLQPLKDQLNIEIDEVLIDGNQELENLYGQLIPVIHVDGKHFSHFRIDLKDFKSFLEKHRQHQ